MSFEYSDDQYRADYESRYPQFSDYQITDSMLAEHKWDRPARPGSVNTYESKYQTEQLGIPTYLGCQCGKCPMSEWPKKPQMRRCTIDERAAILDSAFAKRCPAPSALSTISAPSAPSTPPAPKEPAKESGDQVAESMRGGYMHGTMDQATIMLVLMFIMFVFICYCMKTIIEMKAQLKNLKKGSTD